LCLFVVAGTVHGQDSAETDGPSATPCADTPAHSEFDFWLGSWLVRLAGGDGSLITIRGGMTSGSMILEGATWTEWFEGFYTRMVATGSR
jgi:hypothetical protein